MSWIKTLRESTGLAQWELASLLRINRSTLNMAERDERELPGEANIRLLQIFNAMQAVKNTVPLHKTLPATRQKLAEKLKKEAGLHHIKMLLLQKKITALETRYKTHDQLLVMLTALNHLHASAPPKEMEGDWVEHKMGAHQHAEKDKHLWQLHKLQIKLLAMEAQAKEMEKIMEEMDKDKPMPEDD